jgi:acyl carrier protein
MTKEEIEKIVITQLESYCRNNNIQVEINKDTPLIGSNRILDSMGLVNLIIDIETAFLDEDIEISLASENAMSARISPYRTVSSVCNLITQQLSTTESE